MGHLIAPSILAADFAYLARDIEMVNRSEADWFHIDVMDGVFVPNISFGLPVLKAIRAHTDKFLDVHLMMSKGTDFLEDFSKAGADMITLHIEAETHLHGAVQKIHQLGMKAGIALNPHTPISTLEEILPYIDLVLIMSVNPGFGGQAFIGSSYNKIRKLRMLINSINPQVLIEVDGGVKLDNAAAVLKAGADVLVSGSGIFASEDPIATISGFKNIKSNTLHA